MRTREPNRESALADVLDAVVASDIDAWLVASKPTGDQDWYVSLRLLALTMARDWDDALALDRTAPPPAPDDALARWLRHGVRAWATSGDPAPTASDGLRALLSDPPDPTTATARFAAYLNVEGALAHGLLDLAQQLVDQAGDGLWEPLVLNGHEHPYTPVMGACRARLLAFRGEVTAADAVYRQLRNSPYPTVGALCAATGGLVRGNDADPAEVRRLARLVHELVGAPTDALSAGAHLLVGFGLVALGDVSAAVRSVLAAGLDADLGGCNVIDRTLGLELLVALAVAEGDLDAAEAWRDRASPLLSSPIADSTVARIHSRVLLSAGCPTDAIVWAERAIELARARGRMIEEAEGQILLSRARLANAGPLDRREATNGLQVLVAEAEARGHRAARRAAARELRPLGRRLPPLVGSGWSGLSVREAEVAHWVAEGATNRQVAAILHVSEHTVRAHVSRILAAFGVATRSGLPGAMAACAAGATDEADPAAHLALHLAPPEAWRPALTTRQHQVALLVAGGFANREIGVQLGISVRTVERHVGDILQRWDLPGRTALAHEVRERRTPEPLGR